MILFTSSILQKLAANGRENARRIAEDEMTGDMFPVVKLFQPDGAGTWLLSETDPEEPDIAFGLCDLGFGCPELGSVRISELKAVRGPLGLALERDMFFGAKHRLSIYADKARQAGQIVA